MIPPKIWKFIKLKYLKIASLSHISNAEKTGIQRCVENLVLLDLKS